MKKAPPTPKQVLNKENVKDSVSQKLNAINNKSLLKKDAAPKTQKKATQKTPVPEKPVKTNVDAKSEAVVQQVRERSSKGEIVHHYNAALAKNNPIVSKDAIPVNISQLPAKFLYMYDKPQEKTDALVEHMYVADQVIEKLQLDIPSYVGSVSGSERIFAGRIIIDSATGDGKLNKDSILFEGFTDFDRKNTAVARLDISGVKSVTSFVPGQVVVIKGLHTHPKTIKVSEVYTGIAPPVHQLSGKASLSLVVAAGPFCIDGSVSMDLFDDLLENVKKLSPQVLFLLGPFVDESNSFISSDAFEDSYESIFERFVVKLESLASELNHLQIIVMPSLQDVHADFVYPQPAFDYRSNQKRIHFCSNPSTLNLNGVSVGASSVDIIKHLAAIEYSNREPKDRLQLLAEHILLQQCFLPNFSPSQGIPLDYSQSHYLNIAEVPSILLLASHANHFVYDLHNCLVINPKRLVQMGISAGSYCHIVVHPEQGDAMETDEDNGGIAKRTEVKIVKI